MRPMAATRLTVLILGGYGTFGGRLAQLLDDEPRLTLIGRPLAAKGQSFCAALTGAPTLGRARSTATAMPRRNCGRRSRTSSSTPRARSRPTATIPIAWCAPRSRSASIISIWPTLRTSSKASRGSTRSPRARRVPDLRRRAFRCSPPRWCAVSAPAWRVSTRSGPASRHRRTPVSGMNVVRAIASYAGRPVRVTARRPRDCRIRLIETRRYTIAPPGRRAARHPVRFSLADVPDLQVLPDLWPGLRDGVDGGRDGAGDHASRAQCLRLAVRLQKLLPSLLAVGAGLMHRASNSCSWGEHRGGMYVAIEGRGRDGAPLERSWHMIAEGDDGPFIPVDGGRSGHPPRLDGRRPPAGARPAATDLELADYEPLFARQEIVTGRWQQRPAGASLIVACSGMPGRPCRRRWRPCTMSAGACGPKASPASNAAPRYFWPGWSRRCSASRARGATCRCGSRSSRATGAKSGAAASAAMASPAPNMRGAAVSSGCSVAFFGPFTFGLALVARDGRLRAPDRAALELLWDSAAARAGAAPRLGEFVQDGRFNFDVEIVLPMIGARGALSWLADAGCRQCRQRTVSADHGATIALGATPALRAAAALGTTPALRATFALGAQTAQDLLLEISR